MDGAPPLNTVLDVCGHKHRRIVLVVLSNRQQSMSIDDLTDAVIKYNHHIPQTGVDDETVKRVHVGLRHTHLPKLADAGFIQYDDERKVAQVGREDSNLSTILAMDSDLPTTG